MVLLIVSRTQWRLKMFVLGDKLQKSSFLSWVIIVGSSTTACAYFLTCYMTELCISVVYLSYNRVKEPERGVQDRVSDPGGLFLREHRSFVSLLLLAAAASVQWSQFAQHPSVIFQSYFLRSLTVAFLRARSNAFVKI